MILRAILPLLVRITYGTLFKAAAIFQLNSVWFSTKFLLSSSLPGPCTGSGLSIPKYFQVKVNHHWLLISAMDSANKCIALMIATVGIGKIIITIMCCGSNVGDWTCVCPNTTEITCLANLYLYYHHHHHRHHRHHHYTMKMILLISLLMIMTQPNMFCPHSAAALNRRIVFYINPNNTNI